LARGWRFLPVIENPSAIDIRKILEMLPHRYPFLLVDRVLECVPSESIKAIKNVTINEPFFMGHFPGRPVMPGVMLLEAMAQSTGLLAYLSDQAKKDTRSIYYLVGVDKARFRRPVCWSTHRAEPTLTTTRRAAASGEPVCGRVLERFCMGSNYM
jgi:beta-hydroxyacyl-ACP dehydratase FabZ